MNRAIVIPVAVGVVAGIAALAGVIPGVGGRPDALALSKGATTADAMRDVQEQVQRLNREAEMRAAGIAVAAAIGARMLGVGGGVRKNPGSPKGGGRKVKAENLRPGDLVKARGKWAMVQQAQMAGGHVRVTLADFETGVPFKTIYGAARKIVTRKWAKR